MQQVSLSSLLNAFHFYLQEGKIMPVKYEENSLIWVAVDQPVKDNSFLSSKVLELCGDLPIFWLKPTYPKGNSLNFLNAAGIFPEPFHRPEHVTRKTHQDASHSVSVIGKRDQREGRWRKVTAMNVLGKGLSGRVNRKQTRETHCGCIVCHFYLWRAPSRLLCPLIWVVCTFQFYIILFWRQRIKGLRSCHTVESLLYSHLELWGSRKLLWA